MNAGEDKGEMHDGKVHAGRACGPGKVRARRNNNKWEEYISNREKSDGW